MAVMDAGEDPVAWLRAQIEARLELARQADTAEPWEADKHYDALWAVDLQPSAGMVPGIQQWQDAQVSGIGDVSSYEAPRFLLAFAWHAQHIAANDPQDVIAQCEAELAILDLHEPVIPADFEGQEEWQECRECGPNNDLSNIFARPGGGETFWPCRTVRLLAGAYKRRPGFPEAFAAD
jgi:hypothetical protein